MKPDAENKEQDMGFLKTIGNRARRSCIKFGLALLSLTANVQPAQTQALYRETYRPQFHFSPQKGWIGDPDGLVKYKGTYHLFWWGHAVSEDLVHWKELPYPMQGGGDSFTYFSGSVVVDKANTAGFGDSSLVAVYTMHKTDDVPEAQALSYSNDGVNFHFYSKNPVLDIGSTSFRDPQVFWHTPTNRWIMAAALPHQHKVSFYASANLKQWQHLSDFGPMGAYSSDWEVPDLFQLPIDDDGNNKKWVLSIGQGPNRMQYFLGDFDGNKFTPDSQTIAQSKKSDPALWADYGTDFYAARTWRNIDDTAASRTTWLGWMGNWAYAGRVPTQWGKGFESVPRDIMLRTFDEGVRLVQTPVPELKMLRSKPVLIGKKTVRGTINLTEFAPVENAYELEVAINVNTSASCGVNLLCGDGRKLAVGYNPVNQELFIDRTHCTDFITDTLFNKHFSVVMKAPLSVKNGMLKLHILVDRSSVEVFADDGKVTMSCLTFPSEKQTGIQLFSDGGTATVSAIKAWKLSSIWGFKKGE